MASNAELEATGLTRGRIAIDPGIAFGKSHDEDLQALRRAELRTAGQPLLLAHSRKNYIGSVSGSGPEMETHITTALAYAQGARIFRVHDVAGTRRTLAMAAAASHRARGELALGSGRHRTRGNCAAGPRRTPGGAALVGQPLERSRVHAGAVSSGR